MPRVVKSTIGSLSRCSGMHTFELRLANSLNLCIGISGINREFKQIATAGAATATGSKIVKKRVIAHVSCSHPAVA